MTFVLSAVFAALGQPDRHFLFPIAALFFGYSGIFFLLKQIKNRARVFTSAFIWAAFVFSFQLSWLATTHYHGPGVIFAYLFMVFIFAIQFACVLRSREFSYTNGLALAGLWTLFEWGRLLLFCGFPFSPVGLVLTFHPITMQLASVFGIYGLSFIVIFLSYLFGHAKLKSGFSLIAFLLLLGFIQINYWESKNTKEPFFDIALIQTGLTVEEKEEISMERQWERIFTLLKGVKKSHFDLIVLPEVALQGDSSYHLSVSEKLANHYSSEIVIGLIDGVYNAAFHVLPGHAGSGSERYEKRVLVPLAEYLPFSFLRSFLEGYGITSFFDAGKSSRVFIGKVPFAVSICYEEGFPGLICEGRKKGAELLVNLTNDGWFPGSRLHVEHFNLGRVRAVENGVYVLRSCNTGITGVIDPFGRVVSAVNEVDEQGKLRACAQTASINCFSYPTLFSKFGNIPILLFCFFSLLLKFLIKREACSRVLTCK